jgi:hypothetical protein
MYHRSFSSEGSARDIILWLGIFSFRGANHYHRSLLKAVRPELLATKVSVSSVASGSVSEGAYSPVPDLPQSSGYPICLLHELKSANLPEDLITVTHTFQPWLLSSVPPSDTLVVFLLVLSVAAP